MSLTLEKLPDEILMIIFGYSGDAYSIFQTFLGLNQRINHILLDKRLHLLIDFLCINLDNELMSSYYNSLEFQHLTRTLRLLNGDNEIVHCLEWLVRFHIQNQYIRLDNEFRLNRDHFQVVRKQLTYREIENVDNKLKLVFDELERTSNTIQQIHFLLYTCGARLDYDDLQTCPFDLAKAINHQMRIAYKSTSNHCQKRFHRLISVFKGFIISNPNLLKQCPYLGYGFHAVHFLLLTIFQRRFFFTNQSCTTNLYYYQLLIDLVLFSIRSISHDKSWLDSYFFEVLYIIKSNDYSINNHRNIVIRTIEIELLKILLDESYLQMITPWDDCSKYSFARGLNSLIKNDRMDIVLMMYRHNQLLRNFFQTTDYIEKNCNLMLGNRMRKKNFNLLLDEKPLNICFTTRKFTFELVKKKQFQILKKLLKSSISILNELDENGNDLLLYLCLKVRGCRHRFIQYLIKIGFNIQRKNLSGQSFFDVIELEQNRKLLRKLFEHEIISIDNLNGKIKISSNRRVFELERNCST